MAAQELRINSEEAQGKRQERLRKHVRTESVKPPNLFQADYGSDSDDESSSDEAKESVPVMMTGSKARNSIELEATLHHVNRRPRDATPEPPALDSMDEKQQMDGVSLLELPSVKGRVDRACSRGHKIEDAWVHFHATTKCKGPGKRGRGCSKRNGLNVLTPQFVVNRFLNTYASVKSSGPTKAQMTHYNDMSWYTKVEWPLHHAAITGDLEGIRHAIYVQKIKPNTKRTSGAQSYGRTPMHFAVHFGQIEAVIELIRNGADAFPSPTTLNKTPWQQAAEGWCAHDDITAFLIDFAKTVHGVDVSAAIALRESDESKDSSSKPYIGAQPAQGLFRECMICYQHDLRCGRADETRERYAFCDDCQKRNVHHAKQARFDLEKTRILNRTRDSIKMKNASDLHGLLQDIHFTSDYIVCRGFTLLLIDVDDLTDVLRPHESGMQILVAISGILKHFEKKSADYWAAWGCDIQRLYAFHRAENRFALVVMHDLTNHDELEDKRKPFKATTDKARSTLQILYELIRIEIRALRAAPIGISVGAFAGCLLEDYKKWIERAEEAKQKGAELKPKKTNVKGRKKRTLYVGKPSLCVCDLQTKTGRHTTMFDNFLRLIVDPQDKVDNTGMDEMITEMTVQAHMEFFFSDYNNKSEFYRRKVMVEPMRGFVRLEDMAEMLMRTQRMQYDKMCHTIEVVLRTNSILFARRIASIAAWQQNSTQQHEIWIGRLDDRINAMKAALRSMTRRVDDGSEIDDNRDEEHDETNAVIYVEQDMYAMRASNTKKQSKIVRVSSPESVMEQFAKTNSFKKFTQTIEKEIDVEEEKEKIVRVSSPESVMEEFTMSDRFKQSEASEPLFGPQLDDLALTYTPRN